MEKDEAIRQTMQKQLADMKTSMGERIIQAGQYIQKIEKALEEANTRASQAEIQARELQKTVATWEEQAENNMNQQCYPPASQAVGNSGVEPVEESMESDGDRSLNDHDMEVNRMFDCGNILYKLIFLIGTV